MKQISVLSLFLLLAFFSSCAEVKPQKLNTLKVDNAGTVAIIMYDETQLKNDYRVYVDSVDTNTTLFANGMSEYKITEGKRVIQVVKKRETASLKLMIKKGNFYTLRVIKDEKNHIELVQVANSSGE